MRFSANLALISAGRRLNDLPAGSGRASPTGTASVGLIEAASSSLIGRRLVSTKERGEAGWT